MSGRRRVRRVPESGDGGRSGVGGSEGLLGESERRNGTQYRNGGSASSSCRPRSERGGRAGSVARRARVRVLAACGHTGGTRVRSGSYSERSESCPSSESPILSFWLPFYLFRPLSEPRRGEWPAAKDGAAFRMDRPGSVDRPGANVSLGSPRGNRETSVPREAASTRRSE